jgi:hypothetical protein
MCRKNLHGNVVHTEATKATFETPKSRLISALDLLIPQMGHNAEMLLHLVLVKLASLGCFYKNTRLDLYDHVLIGPEHVKIVKRGTVPMIMRH